MTAVKKKRRLDSRSDLPLVYDQYKPELEGYIRHRVDSAEDTEDILQDVFYKLTKTDLQENPIEYLSAWLYQRLQTASSTAGERNGSRRYPKPGRKTRTTISSTRCRTSWPTTGTIRRSCSATN